jgi:cytochrome c oxidase accessory protein FixG
MAIRQNQQFQYPFFNFDNSKMASKAIQPNFRDTMTTSTKEGGRKWLYPELVKGKWFFRRAWVAYFLLTTLLLGPFLEWEGHPIFLFDILNRTFIVFGIGFGPQDSNLFALGIITFAVFIFAFTNSFARLWCGWACPQTIFMEWVFRPIERLIEGNSTARKKLDETDLTNEKILKKGLKFLFFGLISFGIANVFLAYIIGKNELYKIITDSPKEHWGGLSVLLIFTGVFFFVFSRLREIACILICPYGRLQGTLQDKNSLMVAYELLRGEPRGHLKSGSETKTGDCVDCNWCVKVCPTGIDIRNGNQMECIQCNACIDACDEVMTKIHKPINLVGYYSENEIEKKIPFRLKTKGLAYFGLWAVLISVLGSLLLFRTPVETVVLRTPGNTGMANGPDKIANLYNYEVVNKTFKTQNINFRVKGGKASLIMVGKEALKLKSQQVQKGSFFIEMKGSEKTAITESLELEIITNGKVTDIVKTKFFYLPNQAQTSIIQ